MKGINSLLIAGLFLLNIFQFLEYADYRYGIPTFIKYIISLYVIGILIFYRIRNPLKPVHGGFFYPLIIVFTLMSIIMVIYALTAVNSLFYLQMIFGKRYFFLPYVLPILLLFTKFDLDFLSSLFRWSSILIFPALFIQIYIVLFTISPEPEEYINQENLIRIFDIAGAFLLLTSQISRKKYISYAVIFYFLLWIIMYSIYGRRGELANIIIMLILMIIFRLRSSFLKIGDRMKIYLAGLVIIIALLLYGNLFKSTFVFQRGFNKEAFEESRGVIFEAFFNDFGTTSDWIFGRGINGTVLRSLHDGREANFFENGFITILLKGGLLYSIPFILILLRASYLGLAKSNNEMVKVMGSLILAHVMYMFTWGIPIFSTQFIFIWISVSACFTPEIRKYSNREVYQAINDRFK